MSFVHHIHMQRAVELLEIEGLTIDHASSRVGVASRSHFSRVFKKPMGISPALFRHSFSIDAQPASKAERECKA